MTVITICKEKEKYHIVGDGRMTSGHHIMSDQMVKVGSGKGYIFGICGSASGLLTMKLLLSQSTDPAELLTMIHQDKYKHLKSLVNHVFVACQYHGVYEMIIDSFHDKTDVAIIPFEDDALPMVMGSGTPQVKALLAQHEDVTVEHIKKAYHAAYKVNCTIGGKISSVELEHKPKLRKELTFKQPKKSSPPKKKEDDFNEKKNKTKKKGRK